MSFIHLSPGERPASRLEPLPDGRFRFHHYTALTHPGKVVTGLVEAWGTAYKGIATTEANTEAFAGLLLINADIASNDTGSYVLRIYEQLHPTNRTQVGGLRIITDEDGFESVIVEWLQFASAPYVKPIPGEDSAPGFATAIYSHEVADSDGALRRIQSTYKVATEELRELGAPDIGDDFDAQLQTSGTDCREIMRRYVILAEFAPSKLVQILPPSISDPVYTQAVIVAQKIRSRGDRLTALVYRKFAEVPTKIDEPVNMNAVLPALEDGSYSVVDDFPFRSTPESIPLTARMETEYFMGPLASIERVPVFRPIDEDGNSTNTLTEETRPTAEEYLGWVKSGREIILRCEIRRWQGYIYARDTYHAAAQ